MKSSSTLFFLAIVSFSSSMAQLSDCQPAASTTLLEVNNIRANIGLCNYSFNDQEGSAGFEVPEGSGMNSLYILRDWIGGYTSDNQLHFAGGLYGPTGYTDFYPGPLQNNGLGNTTEDVCESFKKLYHASRLDAMVHHEYYVRLEEVENGADPDILTTAPFENGYEAPEYFYTWPAQNEYSGYSNYLAPFYDWNVDGIYNPDDGDYPGFAFDCPENCVDPSLSSQMNLQGHEVIWQVYNDAGLHSESGGSALGVEIQNITFGFSACGNLGNTLFQQKRFINRSSNTYYETYIGQFADVDLGCYEDDFVGCDVTRGISYVFNGDDTDNDCAGLLGYGTNPPVLAIDLLAGPYIDEDGMDNPLTYIVQDALDSLGVTYPGLGQGYGDGIVDNERIGMSNFLYFLGPPQVGFGINQLPDIATEFHNAMQSLLKNGTHFSASPNGNDPSFPDSDYAFPYTDPLNWATGGIEIEPQWGSSEEPGQRMWVQSCGPFTFEPGEVQETVIAIEWTPGFANPSTTINAMKINSDVIQSHFENCFQLIDNLPLVDEFTFTQSENDLTFSLPFYYDYEAQWNFGDGYTAQGLSVDHTFTETGTFDVCVTVYNCSGPQNICETITITPLDLEEIETESLVLIYPNPVQDELFLHSSRIGKELLGIIIYDARGNRILKARWEADQQSIMLPEDMSAGLYLLNATYSDGLEYSTSFLKSVD